MTNETVDTETIARDIGGRMFEPSEEQRENVLVYSVVNYNVAGWFMAAQKPGAL